MSNVDVIWTCGIIVLGIRDCIKYLICSYEKGSMSQGFYMLSIFLFDGLGECCKMFTNCLLKAVAFC